MRLTLLICSISDKIANASAAESPFGVIKQSGYEKEAGKDVAINEYLIAKTGTLTIAPMARL